MYWMHPCAKKILSCPLWKRDRTKETNLCEWITKSFSLNAHLPMKKPASAASGTNMLLDTQLHAYGIEWHLLPTPKCMHVWRNGTRHIACGNWKYILRIFPTLIVSRQVVLLTEIRTNTWWWAGASSCFCFLLLYSWFIDSNISLAFSEHDATTWPRLPEFTMKNDRIIGAVNCHATHWKADNELKWCSGYCDLRTGAFFFQIVRWIYVRHAWLSLFFINRCKATHRKCTSDLISTDCSFPSRLLLFGAPKMFIFFLMESYEWVGYFVSSMFERSNK